MLRQTLLLAMALTYCLLISLVWAFSQTNPAVEEWNAAFEGSSLDAGKWERFTFEGGTGGTFKVENGELNHHLGRTRLYVSTDGGQRWAETTNTGWADFSTSAVSSASHRLYTMPAHGSVTSTDDDPGPMVA